MDSFKQNILAPSLEIIRDDSKIKKFYFFPGLFSVVFLGVLFLYQVAYTYVVLLGREEEAFSIILSYFHSEYLTLYIIIAVVFVIFYLILIPIFEGALIQYIDSRKDGKASRSDALGVGIFRFYALFEFNNIFNMFKFISIVNGFLFSLRFLGIEYLTGLAIFFVVAFLFSFIVNIVVAYARYEIVLQKKGTFEAIGVSSQISLLNIKTTLKLYFLMFIMNIKVMINFLLFLVFPLFAVFVTGFLTSTIFTTIALFVLGIVFLFLLLVLGYMAAVLDIFTTAIWYHAYKEGKAKLELSEAKE
ncbi:hypothetical protein N9J72_02140 [Candidatus Gracilibacteria bacterium]|nr:hypothetical protein [Candidatus Gracilibacteria bacterium]